MKVFLTALLAINLSAFSSTNIVTNYFSVAEYNPDLYVELSSYNDLDDGNFGSGDVSDEISTDRAEVEEADKTLEELKRQLAAELGRNPYDAGNIDWAMEVMPSRNWEDRGVVLNRAGIGAIAGVAITVGALVAGNKLPGAQGMIFGGILGAVGLGVIGSSAVTALVQAIPVWLTPEEAYELYDQIVELQNDIQVVAENLEEQEALYNIFSTL